MLHVTWLLGDKLVHWTGGELITHSKQLQKEGH
jgi:hypothetical protein